MKLFNEILTKLCKQEEGLALTEYLILLGLLTAAVVVAITAFGGGLEAAWTSWTTWLDTNTGAPS